MLKHAVADRVFGKFLQPHLYKLLRDFLRANKARIACVAGGRRQSWCWSPWKRNSANHFRKVCEGGAMTKNDRWTARAGQLTVSAFIHRALTRAGISLVVAATFAAASAQAQEEGGTTAQQAPAGAPKQPEETKNQADTLKPKKL